MLCSSFFEAFFSCTGFQILTKNLNSYKTHTPINTTQTAHVIVDMTLFKYGRLTNPPKKTETPLTTILSIGCRDNMVRQDRLLHEHR